MSLTNELKIKELRVSKKLSQQDLADAIGVPRGRINAWEMRGTVPKAEDYNKIVEFFDLDTNVSTGNETYTEHRRHLKNNNKTDVPMYSGYTTLGNIEIIDDENVKHKVMAHLPAEVFPGCDYAEKAQGDSMHPVIQNQAILAGKTCPGLRLIRKNNFV